MSKLISKLFKANLISPKGIMRFAGSAISNGVNLLAMLEFTAKMYTKRIAITAKNKQISYEQLYQESKTLAFVMKNNYSIKPKKKVAIICKNHISEVKSIFAISGLGAELYLLNPEFSTLQLESFMNRTKFDLAICDSDIEPKLNNIIEKHKIILSYHDEKPAINNLSNKISEKIKLPKKKSGSIIVLTGGTSGKIKIAKRKPSIFDFLNPFFALLTKLDLDKFSTVFIATPIFHGFGLATVIISTLLGTKMFLLKKFETRQAVSFIKSNQIEVITLVPVMLKRMLEYNKNDISSLQKIITGGAILTPVLAKKTSEVLGDVLFNLYGTSEAGFSVMATPSDLKSKPSTIGKPIQGVKLKIINKEGKTVENGKIGMISIKNTWSMYNKNDKNVATGDLGYIDDDGHLFLSGRADDMIVSGGENVYPIVVENILLQHPHIDQVAIIGIKDEEFGQRLKAFVVPKKNHILAENIILEWLKDKIARFQMPAKIEFIDELPVTDVGKINKKALHKL